MKYSNYLFLFLLYPLTIILILSSSSCKKTETQPIAQTKLHVSGRLINLLDSSGIPNSIIYITDEYINGGITDGLVTVSITDINGNYSADIIVAPKHEGFKISVDTLFTDSFLNETPYVYYLNVAGVTIDNNKLNLAVYQKAYIHVTFKNLSPIVMQDHFTVDRSTELDSHFSTNSGFDFLSLLGKTELKINTFTIAKVNTYLDIIVDQNNSKKRSYDTLFLNPKEVKEIIVQ